MSLDPSAPRPSQAETSPSYGQAAARAPRRTLDTRAVALLAIAAMLAYGAFRTLWPYATAIVLGGWVAHLVRPVFRRLHGALHGRQKAAAVLTGGMVLLVAAPVALAVTALVPAARSLVDQLRSSGGGRGALAALVSNGAGTEGGMKGMMQLVKEHGLSASKAAALLASASIEALVGVFLFFVVFFAALVDGQRANRWLEANAPIDPAAYGRLRDAFFEAGKGLLVGNGLTALVQGGIATITYVALGVPRALLLGLLSVVAALIPMTGPTIVWVPVAAGLLLTGHPLKAAILVGVGVAVVGTADNVLRPYLAKRAHVGLDTSVVLLAIFGGIALFGGWGLLLGPLLVRLAMEGMQIVRERGLLGPPPAGKTPEETHA